MKKTLKSTWNAIGTTGRIFVCCFLFYFVTKSMQK